LDDFTEEFFVSAPTPSDIVTLDNPPVDCEAVVTGGLAASDVETIGPVVTIVGIGFPTKVLELKVVIDPVDPDDANDDEVLDVLTEIVVVVTLKFAEEDALDDDTDDEDGVTVAAVVDVPKDESCLLFDPETVVDEFFTVDSDDETSFEDEGSII